MSSRQPTQREFSPELLRALEKDTSIRQFHKREKLFQRGSEATGLYVLESGEVHVLLPERSRQHLLKIVGPGTILGLSEIMTGESYRITAEASIDTTVAYIPREELLAFFHSHGEFCSEVLRLLSEDLHVLYRRYASINTGPGRRTKMPVVSH
jgi:CRP-like cAMP-binding protein